ncbi:unnamed protein product [Brassica oleracea]|uniref:Uncharacterized protein n=1 Tax=Brassica oleracea TaxID=3712 RepID=A0A3P6EF31_BRAOL|nr:unnamed protein product [Brassica oleracea]
MAVDAFRPSGLTNGHATFYEGVTLLEQWAELVGTEISTRRGMVQ